MKRELTCIICPQGCSLLVDFEDGKVLSVTGNTCPRGVKYAESECISPKRTVTSTIRCDNNSVVSVKTDRPIPKDKVFSCMKIINKKIATLPIVKGDVIIENVFGANIVATQNKI
ncbi:MAG: DUF1667 domain-containing protein [Ruminococcaceae bacterium]|nr:DUF1667 domain-containing protein [Oscillospiraceae bacterium]